MWYKEYRDYPPDSPLIQDPLSSGKGIIGCEMHEPNGWGESYHLFPAKSKVGFFRTFFGSLFQFLEKGK